MSTSSSSLLAEVGDAVANLMLAERNDMQVKEWLSRRGLTPLNRALAGGVGMVSARLDRQRDLWMPDLAGERVLTLPCWDGPSCEFCIPWKHPSPLVDLIAFPLRAEPHRPFRRTGEGRVIGIEGINFALEAGEPLRLFRNPLAFVAHGGERGPAAFAAMLIDPDAAFWALEGVAEVVADDLDHAEWIDSLLRQQRPAMPAVSILTREAVAA